MPWRPLPRIAYAVATYPFKPSAPSDLPLELGDELYIIEEGGRNYDWYRGYLVAPPSLLAGLTSTRGRSLEKRVFEGVFPRVCVEVREFLGEDLEEDDDDPMELIIQGSDAGDRTSLTNGHGPRGSVTSRPESRHTQETASSKKKTPSKRTSASEPPGSRPVSRKSAAQKDHELYRMTSRSSKSKKSRRSGLPLTFVAAQRDPNAPKPPAPAPMLKIGDESAQYADEPLVEEISSCLREWQSTNLHDLLLAREYSKLEQMSQLVRRLNLARQQLLLNILTRHELDALREKIVWDLVYGNRLLNGDVIVRDPAERGRLLVGDDSAIEVSKLQSIMSLLDKPPTSTSHDVTLLHHLLLDIHSFRGASPKPTMLVFYLLAKTAGSAPRQISENFIVNIEAGGQPSNFALAGRMKALFTDLNAADIGEMASSDSALYLIVRVQGQRPFDNKTTATIPPPSRDGSRSALSVSSGSQKGRRSMMWSSKGNSESQSSSNRTRSSGNNSSSTSTSQQPEDTPTSQNAEKVAKLKRIIGMGAIRIDSIIRQGADAERVVEIWTPTTEGRAESTPVDIIQEILPSRSGKYKRTSIAETVRVHLMPFVSPDADILVEKSPSLLQDVARSPKIGFSVEPTKPRSDIYLTLNEAFFPLQGRLSHPKNGSLPIPTHTGLTNLQATLEVRKASGERAERCIFPSCSNEGKPNGQSTFPRDLRAIFKSFEELMKNITPTLVGSKTLLVQHFHTWLPELSGILTHKEILQLAIDFLDSCSDVQGKLLLYKLVLIIHISELNFFPTPDLRRLWISSTARWLNPHWGTVDVFTEQWREQVRLCCSVLSTQIRDLGPEVSVYVPKIIESYRVLQAIPRQNKDTLSILFSKNYPFQTKSTSDKYAFDEAMIELASVLAAISQSPNGIALNVTSDDLPVTLFNILQMQLSILNFDSFPDSWFSLHIYHHKSALAILEYVSDVLLGSFLPPPDEAVDFKTELWKAFFETLLKLIGSDYLALEMFPEQKRRAVWKIAGDLREQGAELLRRTWEAIGWDTTSEDRRRYGLDKVGGYQVQYVPALVSQVVNLCMSAHEGLRRVAVDMLQTMIVSEWTLSGDLTVIKEEVVDCLDHLFRSAPSGEALTQKAFLSELTELFEPLSMIPDDPLLRALQDLVATTDEFLDILAAAHVAEMAGEASALMQTLNIMEFLREMKSDQNYIAHIHRLVEIQRKAGYHVEAGLAIKFHADLYEWNPTRILPEIHEPYFPEQTEFERKEHLYRKMIGWYNMGKAWDLSIAAHQELAANYRDITFNFRKLTKTEKDIADLHEHVADGEYSIPKYYRVIFRGLGWPAGIKDKQFIYTAFRTENTTKFSERILAQNPNATIVQEGDFDTREGQFIQIVNVVPLRKFTHGSYQRPAVASSIRDFSTCASPELFVPVVRATSDVHDEIRRGKWVERYVYRTAEKFPTIARRSEIVETFPDRVSPIKSAIDRTSRKTQEMEDEVCWQISRAEDWEPTFPALLSSIRQSVSPKSTNSVAHYRELLPKAGAPNQEGNLTAEMNREEIALKVALIDHALVIKKALGLVIAGRHFPTIRELRENFEVTFAPELATKVEVEPDTLELDNDPPRPAEYRARTPDHNSEPLAPLSGEYHRPNPSTSHSRRSNNERQPTNSSVGRIGGTPNLPQFDGTAESFLDTGSTSSQADKSRKSRSPSHATSNGPQGQRPSSQMNHVSSETKRSLSEPRLDRPPTSSTTTTSMTQDDVKVKEKGSSGSIRKRFSVLGIGKKGSKNSVRDRSAFGAHQKVIEE